MALNGFQTNAFQNNAFQMQVGPVHVVPSIWDVSDIYMRDAWRTVLRVFNYSILFSILLGM